MKDDLDRLLALCATNPWYDDDTGLSAEHYDVEKANEWNRRVNKFEREVKKVCPIRYRNMIIRAIHDGLTREVMLRLTHIRPRFWLAYGGPCGSTAVASWLTQFAPPADVIDVIRKQDEFKEACA